MQKSLLALVLIMSSVAFASSSNGMIESEFISADQIVRYQELPQMMIVRTRALHGNGMVEIARFQYRLDQDKDLTQARLEQILSSPKTKFQIAAPNSASAFLPKIVKSVKNKPLKSLITDRSDDSEVSEATEPYYLGLRAHYRDRGYQLRQSFNLGYPIVKYYDYIYTYLPYGPLIQVGDYVYAFYSWTNYYQ